MTALYVRKDVTRQPSLLIDSTHHAKEKLMIEYEYWSLLNQMDGAGTRWQILGYPDLRVLSAGQFDVSRVIATGGDLRAALQQAATSHAFVPLTSPFPVKHVRILVNQSSVLLEPGAMHFTKGAIQMGLDGAAQAGGIGSFLKKAVTTVASGESMIKPRFSGTGEIYLEPRADHLMLIPLNNETLVCDRGLWVACDGTLAVDGQVNTFSAMVAGGEGAVQPRVRGSGVVLLQSRVPREQILEVNLNNEELRVDGPFVMAYCGAIEFTVERSGKGILSSTASGEGVVNVYRGSGKVWMNLVQAGCFRSA